MKLQNDTLLQKIRLQAQQADERATRAEERDQQAEVRATRAEQQVLEMKLRSNTLLQQIRLQVQHTDERATRAEERDQHAEVRATSDEQQPLYTKQQSELLQQQIGLHAPEDRVMRTEHVRLKRTQWSDTLQQHITLQVQQADEKARRAEEGVQQAEVRATRQSNKSWETTEQYIATENQTASSTGR